jgi:hypothetical protein
MSCLDDDGIFSCDYCPAVFSTNSNRLKHMKTNKKCLSTRQKIEVSCVWCNISLESNIQLEKHSKKCTANKEIVHITLKKEYEQSKKDYEKRIEDLTAQLKDANDKIFSIANKPTNTTINNSRTYNTSLNCDKPLDLTYDKVLNIMKEAKPTQYLKSGSTGLGSFFVKNVCVNDKGNTSIECTDKKRKIFKGINSNEEQITLTGDEIYDLVIRCYYEYKKTDSHKEFEDWLDEKELLSPASSIPIIKSILCGKKEFLDRVISLTHIDSPQTLIKKE